MTTPLVTALIVSGIGMLMLFVAMALLYGLMVGMTALIKEPSPSSPQGRKDAPSSPPRSKGAEERRRAAAIAVALARAELEMDGTSPPGSGADLSPWSQYHHQRQLGQRGWVSR